MLAAQEFHSLYLDPETEVVCNFCLYFLANAKIGPQITKHSCHTISHSLLTNHAYFSGTSEVSFLNT